MIHILHNLPKEYDSLVEDMEKALDDASSPLDVEIMKERLHLKWEQMNRRYSSEDNDELVSSEALFTRKQFKGRCRMCGKIGHKGENCWKNPNRKGGNDISKKKAFSDYGSSFKGNCMFCREKGHMEKFCLKKNSGNRAMVAENEENEGISLFAIDCERSSEDDDSTFYDNSLPELLIYDSSDEDSYDDVADDSSQSLISWEKVPRPGRAEEKMCWQGTRNDTNDDTVSVNEERSTDVDSRERKEWDDDSNDKKKITALIAMHVPSNEKESSYDSWVERSTDSDESPPFVRCVTVTTRNDDNNDDVVETERIREEMMDYLENLSIDTNNSLYPFPEPYTLGNASLNERLENDPGWNDEAKSKYLATLRKILKVKNDDVTSYDSVLLTTFIKEEKWRLTTTNQWNWLKRNISKK